MKKNIKFILIMLMLIVLVLPITYSYAKAGESAGTNALTKSFFEVSKLEVAKSEKVEMTINLDEIKYNKFLFELESSESIDNLKGDNNIEITNGVKALNNSETANTGTLADSGKLEAEKSGNEIAIEINKETTNLSTITLYYQIPETMQVNDTIKFVAKVTNLENSNNIEEGENSGNSVNSEESVSGNNKNENVETQIVEAEVKIIEDTNQSEDENGNKPETGSEENTNKPENGQNNNINNESENKVQGMEQNAQSNIQRLTEQSSNNNSNVKIATTSMTSVSSQKTEQTVTYNGSDNNYLSELSVSGYTLNKEFTKDNSTYFITVENDVESLEIISTEDDSTSTVCVYGNDSLSEGTNKILISVTAENGNVRNYRIYVTKK